MSTRLFLIRHAESTWSAAGLVQGQADPPLSTAGERQAVALAAALRSRPLAAVITSPLSRARQTAEAIAVPHGLSLHLEDALKEVSLGSRQGHLRAEMGGIDAALTGGGREHGGESLEQALDRVAPAITAILTAYRDATLALVTHSLVGRVLLAHLLGTGLALVPHLKLKQASISLVRLEAHGAVLEGLSDTGHLRHALTMVAGGAPQ
jgi:broad specificity phosphatase PhoE